MMIVDHCALGVVQKRGATVIDPSVVTIGDAEIDYLARHVGKVRAITDASARGMFADGAATPQQLEALRTTDDDAVYQATAKALQDSLALAMKTSTNARDCVFAIVRARDTPNSDAHMTLLKLDAVVEAARMRVIEKGGVTFKVLKELLPEPGKLQKALSWPDPRQTSDVIMLDTNVTSAQYFENAYHARVSPKSAETERDLARILHERVPLETLPDAIATAAEFEGPLDTVLEALAETHPELADVVDTVAGATRPPGIIRANKVAARPVVWRADGVEVRVPPQLAGGVSVERSGDGWRIAVQTRSEPRREE